MNHTTKYVGLDVSKGKVADAGREEPRYLVMVTNSPEAIRKLVRRLGDKENLRVCYEAVPLYIFRRDVINAKSISEKRTKTVFH